MTTPDIHQSVTALKKEIEKLNRKRRTYIDKANTIQTRIVEAQKQLVITVGKYAAEMGVQVSVRAPRTNPPRESRCSICVSKGLPGDGHTAARHYALVVSGEIPGMKVEEEVR